MIHLQKKYTLVRKTYGMSFTAYMSDEQDGECFIFDTEKEAYKCLSYFGNGEYFNDDKYGKIRYYVDTILA